MSLSRPAYWQRPRGRLCLQYNLPDSPRPPIPLPIGDRPMQRREMLLTTGAAALGLSTFPFGWAAAAEKKKQKLLYFTRSAGFEHGAVKRKGDELSFSEKVMTEMGERPVSMSSARRTGASSMATWTSMTPLPFTHPAT